MAGALPRARRGSAAISAAGWTQTAGFAINNNRNIVTVAAIVYQGLTIQRCLILSSLREDGGCYPHPLLWIPKAWRGQVTRKIPCTKLHPQPLLPTSSCHGRGLLNTYCGQIVLEPCPNSSHLSHVAAEHLKCVLP